MALFNIGKKNEQVDPNAPPSDMGIPPPDIPMPNDNQVLQENSDQQAQPQGQEYHQQYVDQSYQQPMQDMPPQQMQYQQPQLSHEHVQQIIETMLQEKTTQLNQHITSLDEWKNQVQTTLAQFQQQIQDVKHDLDILKQGIVGKIGEYDSNLKEVGTEIKAMEKVFQKVLPSLTESVNKLDRITKHASTKTTSPSQKKNPTM